MLLVEMSSEANIVIIRFRAKLTLKGFCWKVGTLVATKIGLKSERSEQRKESELSLMEMANKLSQTKVGKIAKQNRDKKRDVRKMATGESRKCTDVARHFSGLHDHLVFSSKGNDLRERKHLNDFPHCGQTCIFPRSPSRGSIRSPSKNKPTHDLEYR